MRPTFHPRLLNGPFGDPVVLVNLLGMGRKVFLDLGDIGRLPVRPVLRASHAFVSHAHIDHFCGLDTVIRYCLGRAVEFTIAGPPGISDRVQGKLNGYTWNLVSSIDEAFTLKVLEWRDDHIYACRFSCVDGFSRKGEEKLEIKHMGSGLREIYNEPAFRAIAAEMDHQIPCLAYRLEERVHVNISRPALEQKGLVPGPWIKKLKELAWRNAPADSIVETDGEEELTLGELFDSKVIIASQGQKLAYVADCAWRQPGIDRAAALCADAHILYCEAAFLDEDKDRARKRCHLTASQAGLLAKMSGVKELRIFHFSPKYRGREEELKNQAEKAFGGPVSMPPSGQNF